MFNVRADICLPISDIMKKQILVTDDHTIVRKGVVSLLKENFPFFQTAEAETAAETIRFLKQHTYDLLILDLNLPDANAEKVISQVRQEAMNTPIIVFSMFPVNVMEKPMLKLGVSKYVNKGDDLNKLLRAVEEIVLGRVHVEMPEEKQMQGESPFAELSPKELSVMMSLFDGKSNKQIAHDLDLSASTVATYKQRVLEKTNTSSLTDLLKVAMKFNVYSFLQQT